MAYLTRVVTCGDGDDLAVEAALRVARADLLIAPAEMGLESVAANRHVELLTYPPSKGTVAAVRERNQRMLVEQLEQMRPGETVGVLVFGRPPAIAGQATRDLVQQALDRNVPVSLVTLARFAKRPTFTPVAASDLN